MTNNTQIPTVSFNEFIEVFPNASLATFSNYICDSYAFLDASYAAEQGLTWLEYMQQLSEDELADKLG